MRRFEWRRILLRGGVWLSIGFGLNGCVAGTQSAHVAALRHAWGETTPTVVAEDDPAWDETSTLDRASLVAAVLARNPSVEAARRAWRAALARYPQVTAFEDPVFQYQGAPASPLMDQGYGQVIQISQTLPWPGRQHFRGAIALAETEVQVAGLARVRLHLALAASLLFDDAYVVDRGLAINAEHVALVQRLKASAEAQYAAGQGSQQDPLQADVELALLERERLTLEARRQVIVAQLNGLLHRAPESSLPRPPETVQYEGGHHESARTMEDAALRTRPELRAAAHRVLGAQASVSLAELSFFPDISLSATYNSMWARVEHQFMLGVSLRVPLMLDRRHAAVTQAEAEEAQARAAQEVQRDAIRVQVREAWIRWEEAQAQLRLHHERLLPAIRRQIAAAESGYESGRTTFAALMAVERRLRTCELRHEEAVADIGRRHAQLMRALGRTPTDSLDGGSR